MKGLCGFIAAFLFAATAAGPACAVTATGTLTATLIRPISVAKNADLSFGRIVRPTSGSTTVTLSAAGARSALTNGAFWLASPASTAASFTVSGEGAQQFTLTIPGSVTLTNSGPGGGSLSVTTSNDAACTSACALSGSIGGGGSKSFNVGGSFTLTSTTATGTYAGSLSITATYN